MYKKWILFLLIYSLSTFLLFIYILFPTDTLKKKIETLFSEHFPGQLSISEISLGFPDLLVMKKSKITFPNGFRDEGPISMHLDEIKAGVNFFKIPRGKIGIDLDLSIGDGTINTEISKKWIGQPKKYFFCKAEEVSIQELPILAQKFGIHVTGLIRGEVNMEWSGNDITDSTGTWSFTTNKGRVIPVHFPSFNYSSAQGEGFIKRQMIQIEEIKIQGDDLSLSATGQIKTGPNFSNLLVETEVKLKILTGLHKKLGPFTTLLPSADSDGYINLFIHGPPGALHFSHKKKG